LHHLAGINNYLFLKDFLVCGGVGDQKKPCCRWPASAGAEKSGTVLLKLCGGDCGEGNAEKQKPEMKMQKPGVTRLLHKHYLLLLGYFLLGYFLFSFRFFLRCHDRLLKS
jgi:hypothetical protein